MVPLPFARVALATDDRETAHFAYVWLRTRVFCVSAALAVCVCVRGF